MDAIAVVLTGTVIMLVGVGIYGKHRANVIGGKTKPTGHVPGTPPKKVKPRP